MALSVQAICGNEEGGVSGGVGGVAILEVARRRFSTVVSKKSAICWSLVSSGVRMPRSQGDHCCGETFLPMQWENASAHFLPPPRPGKFFTRSARMLAAIVLRSSSSILPIDSPFSVWPPIKKRRQSVREAHQLLTGLLTPQHRTPPKRIWRVRKSRCHWSLSGRSCQDSWALDLRHILNLNVI